MLYLITHLIIIFKWLIVKWLNSGSEIYFMNADLNECAGQIAYRLVT